MFHVQMILKASSSLDGDDHELALTLRFEGAADSLGEAVTRALANAQDVAREQLEVSRAAVV